MSSPDAPDRIPPRTTGAPPPAIIETIAPGIDDDEERTSGGGAGRAREPRGQDSAGPGRGVGLGITTIVGIALLGVPLIWAVAYVNQAGAAGLGGGVTLLFAIVMVAVFGAGAVLLRGLLKS